MCGRYAIGKLQWWILQENFKLQQAATNLEPRWNVAPTQLAPIIRQRSDAETGNELAMARWGLVPHFWHKPLSEMKYSTFNAKAETAADLPSFRHAFRRHHCIVPAVGFYEWTGEKGAKQPWFIGLKDTDWFGMAGLWDRAEIEGAVIDSFTILTIPANDAMKRVHNRMPVMLRPQDCQPWLEPHTADIDLILKGPPSEAITMHEANEAVGNVRSEGEWLTRADDGAQRGGLL